MSSHQFVPLVFSLVTVLSKFPFYLHISKGLFQISNVTVMTAVI